MEKKMSKIIMLEENAKLSWNLSYSLLQLFFCIALTLDI